MLAFLLLYRLAEAQLLKLVTPFLLDPREAGGLGLAHAGRGHRLRHGGRGRAHAGRAARRLAGLAPRAQAAAVAAGAVHALPNLVFVALACGSPAAWRW